jgi:hypothetical protein
MNRGEAEESVTLCSRCDEGETFVIRALTDNRQFALTRNTSGLSATKLDSDVKVCLDYEVEARSRLLPGQKVSVVRVIGIQGEVVGAVNQRLENKLFIIAVAFAWRILRTHRGTLF